MIVNANWAASFRNGRYFWLLSAFLVIVFLLGGGSRGDIVSLIILRPLAVILLAWSLLGLRREQYRALRPLFVFGALCLALAVLHIVPLPPVIWTALPGRDLAVEVGRTAGVATHWRPLSLIPDQSHNAFFSLFVPLAALALLARCTIEQRRSLLLVILVIGFADAFLTVAQLAGPPDGPLYFYEITNSGGAVGLFANRNHNAVFLATLFPLLAVYAATRRTADTARSRLPSTLNDVRPLVIAAGGLALVPLLLVAGSRGGAIVGIVALLWVPIVLIGLNNRDAVSAVSRHWRGLAIIVTITLVAFMTILFSRAVAIQRLLDSGGSAETRFVVWGPIADMARMYFPVGSGLGSFVEIFQIDEPLAALDTTYLNHAHNDYLEVVLTAGLPGVALILLAAGFVTTAGWKLWMRRERVSDDILLGRAGVATVFLLALASVADYPLRVPSLACLFVVGIAWLVDGTRRNDGAKT